MLDYNVILYSHWRELDLYVYNVYMHTIIYMFIVFIIYYTVKYKKKNGKLSY